jgi:diphosphomevalonate decarboxylase
VTERSAFKMHAVGLGAEPPLLYWQGATVECVRRVWTLRAGGVAAWVTIDAGPQVKVLCDAASAGAVRDALAATAGVERVVVCRLGQGATVLA